MVDAQQLDPRIRIVWTVGAVIPAVVLGMVALALAVANVPIAPPVVAGVALLVGIGAVLIPAARWRSWSYRLTDTELIVRFGVLIKVERWLPRTRIQHVDLIGGPVERSLGLRQLVIYTAGTREADVTVPGLPAPIAEELRDDLLSWVRSATEMGSPLETGVDAPIVPGQQAWLMPGPNPEDAE